MEREKPRYSHAGPRDDHRNDPEFLVPLRERVKTPEQEKLYEFLQDEIEYIRRELALDVKFEDERMRDPLPNKIVHEVLNRIAVKAREFSDHYGGYKVGGVLIGLRKPTAADPNPWVVMFDANTRPSQNVRKHCAEQYLLDRADAAQRDRQLENVVALFVVAPPRDMPDDPVGLKDDVSQKKQITLTPCELCRARIGHMAEEPGGIVNPRYTEIITARSDVENLALRKMFKAGDQRVFHGEALSPEYTPIGGDD